MEAQRFLLVALFLAACSVARAQVPASAQAAAALRPADFDPKALSLTPRPRSAAARAIVKPEPKPVAVTKSPDDPSLAVPRFRVNRLKIEGNVVLPVAELGRLTKTVEGRSITLEELDTVAAAIEKAYRKRGYFLARVAAPPQEVTGGTVRLVVSPGRYGAVQVDGAQHYSREFLTKFFRPAIQQGLVRERPLLEALLQLNGLPDLSVQSVFTPGQAPGTTDVILRVHDERPLHIAVDYNNFGSRLVGRNRIGLTLSGGLAFTEGDEMVLRVVEPFHAASDPFYQASYTRPIGHRFDRVGVLFASGQTRVRGRGLDDLDIRGTADIAGITWQRPLVSTQDEQTQINASFQGKNIRNFVINDRPTSHDKLRYLTGGITTSRRMGDRRVIGSALISQGLGTIFDGSPNINPLANRAGTGNNFSKLTLDGSLIQQLDPEQFLVIRVSTQLSTRPLTVAEQFAIGGPDSVRGYIQSENLGDEGFGVSAEYRRELYSKRSRTLQGVAFADHGYSSVKRPQPGEPNDRTLTGAGVGLRAYSGSESSVRLDVGFPLSPSRNVDADDVVLYAQASHRY